MLLEAALLAHLLTTAPAPSSPPVPAGRYVLVNGLLSPGEWDDALAVPLDAETDLRIKQDDRSVFLALVFKGPRHTGLDLYWSAGGPPEMFHVSSALGERRGTGAAWSDMEWGTNRLWTANPVGLVSGAGGQQPLAPEAFEIQIDKTRLGGLDLRLFVHLKRPEKKLPAGAALEKPESWLAVPLRTQTEKVSSFGKYSGYSEPVYDGWTRSSQYVAVRDGTRLAIEIFRPTRAGKVAEEKLPVVWTLNRYRCAQVEEGKTYTILDTFEWLQDVLRHGYVVACVDARGSGASFGTFEGMFSLKETQDAYDLTEWLGTQSWSNGNVGMYGRSYLGITQYMVAGQKPPHLKALFPEVAVVDMYELIYKGGIYHGPFIEMWSTAVREMDVDQPAMPVDEDRDGSLLKAAVEQHKANRSAADIFAALPYRDSVDRASGAMPFRDWTPITYLKQIRETKVPIYHLAGWYDRYVRDQLVLYRNLGTNPQRISIGPWTHTQREHFDFAAEHLRWWDYWLKGIDNGVMQEDPVHYYVMGAPPERAWRSARTWPLPQERRTAYWFGNNGGLGTEAPKGKGAKDEFTVDYSAAIAPDPRWSVERQFPELSSNDAKGLTYTTPPLTAPLEVTGHPLVHL